MAFISDDQIEKQTKAIQIKEKVEKKIENTKIIEQARKDMEKKHVTSDSEMIKIITKQNKSKPANPKISIADIQKELEVVDLFEERKKEEILNLLENPELREIKNEVIGVLAIPMSNPDKRKLFHYKLATSDTINNYVNDNVLFRCFNRTNNHLKFGAVYALKYLQTNAEYNAFLKQREQQQQKE